ncbi:hypothetical protein [Thauera sp. WH-1]|uniref:hypothetical protein n=1 Tax=Thauera sp. WH-1 TaxID=3398230 RepID=UPI0039FDA8A5
MSTQAQQGRETTLGENRKSGWNARKRLFRRRSQTDQAGRKYAVREAARGNAYGIIPGKKKGAP